MKPQSKISVSLLLAAFVTVGISFNSNCLALAFQQGPSRGSIATPRDPEQEKQSYKSLDAAKFYFYKRNPKKGDKDGAARLNKAVLDRLQEIIDLNPNFGRIEEVYFMMGEVYLKDGDTEKAVEFWTKATKEGSDEKIKADAQKRLDEAQNQKKKG